MALRGGRSFLLATKPPATVPATDSAIVSLARVGNVAAGDSIAGLYTLIATCEARGINPFAYLADVIARVQDHPAQRLDELLPGAWARAAAA